MYYHIIYKLLYVHGLHIFIWEVLYDFAYIITLERCLDWQ